MKRNEINSNILSVVDSSILAVNSMSQSSAAKKQARESADTLINNAIANSTLAELMVILTDEFAVLSEVGYFGIEEKTGNGQSVAAKRKQNAGRFFARSIKALDNGLKISGTSPFVLGTATVKAVVSKESKLSELIIELGGNTDTVSAITTLLAECKVAADERQAASRKIAEDKQAVQKTATQRSAHISYLATLSQEDMKAAIKTTCKGMTAGELSQIVKEVKTVSNC